MESGEKRFLQEGNQISPKMAGKLEEEEGVDYESNSAVLGHTPLNNPEGFARLRDAPPLLLRA